MALSNGSLDMISADSEMQNDKEMKPQNLISKSHIYQDSCNSYAPSSIYSLHLPRHLTLVTPPENFAMVAPLIYRSAFPKAENFEYMKRLKLKSVLCLVSDPYPPEHEALLREQGIQFFQFGMPGNKVY